MVLPLLEHVGPSYDILNLLNVAKRLVKQNNTSIKFLIAGDGPLKKLLKSLFVKMELQTVLYLGNLNLKVFPYLYNKSDVGLSILYRNIKC